MNEQQKDLEWLGEIVEPDLLDQSYDLSQGSTKEWWESVKEINMDLHGVSTEDLEAEILRRQKEEWDREIKAAFQAEIDRQEREAFEKPKVLNDNFPKGIVQNCIKYRDEVWVLGEALDDDLKQYVFEAAMEAIFGEKVFERLNQRSRSLHEQSKKQLDR